MKLFEIIVDFILVVIHIGFIIALIDLARWAYALPK